MNDKAYRSNKKIMLVSRDQWHDCATDESIATNFGGPWVQLLDSGGGQEAKEHAARIIARSIPVVFDGGSAQNPRTGIEVLHRNGHDTVVQKMVSSLQQTYPQWPINVHPWSEAPASVVVVLGRAPES